MSPRPRQTSDEAILMATMRVMQRRSSVDLTLADVAKEAGVVPATLIQRFGSALNLNVHCCFRDGTSQFPNRRTNFRHMGDAREAVVGTSWHRRCGRGTEK